MDDSSGVGAVTSSSGVSSTDSGDGSGGEAGNVHGVGGGDIGVASGDGVVDEGSSNGDGGDSLDLSNGGGGSNDGRGSNSVGVVSVAEAVVVAEAGVRVASISGVAQTVSTVSGVAESVVSVSVVGVSLGISLSLPLGDMDDSGRVGNITSSSGVTSSDGRDSSSGKAGDADGGGGGDAGVAGSNGGDSGVGVAKAVGVAAVVAGKTVASVASVQEVGVGLSLRGSHSGRSHAEDSLQDDCHVMWIVNHEWIYELHQEINERMNVGQWVTYKELVHLDVFGNCEEHYPLEFRAVVIPNIATHRLL